MKAKVLGFLCFLMVVYPTTAQSAVWSSKIIEGRAKILDQIYDWYMELDASFFNIFTHMRAYTKELVVPMVGLSGQVKGAFEKLPKEDLSADIANNLTKFINGISQTLDYVLDATEQMPLAFSTQFDSPGLTPPSQKLHYSVTSTLYQFLSSFGYPPFNSCEEKIMPEFIPLYQPYINEQLSTANQRIESFDEYFSRTKDEINIVIENVRTLIGRIENCETDPARNECVKNFIDEYQDCNFSVCNFERSLYNPLTEADNASNEITSFMKYYDMGELSGEEFYYVYDNAKQKVCS